MPSQCFLKWLGLSDRPNKLKWNILIYEGRKEIMFFCPFNGFLKIYIIIIKILWKLYEIFILSREEMMFFCRFNGFLNHSQPNWTNFQENSLSLLYLSYSTQNLAWQNRENHQKINRNDPYNPDQELTWFRFKILTNNILTKNLLSNWCLPNKILTKGCLPKNILPFDRHTPKIR